MAHTWSLGVEEQFYILWPSVLAIVLLRGLRAAWWTAIAGTLAATLLFLVVAGAGATARRSMEGSDSWVASLLLGAAIAIGAHRSGRIPWSAPLAAALGAGALVMLAEAQLTRLAVPLTALAATPVIAWAAAHPSALSWRWLTGTGRISYGMYLWHYPIAYGFWPITSGLPWPLALLVVTALTYMLAAASWMIVERRFLAARRGRSESPPPLSAQ